MFKVDEEKMNHLQRNKKFLENYLNKGGGSTWMWCSQSQCRSCHVVTGSLEPEQKRGRASFVSVKTRTPTIALPRHRLENVKVAIKLPCVLCCPGEADSR